MSSTRQAPLVRMAHVVGDFGNPFYAEERQRDVWNEASAFGLQLLLWSAVLASSVTVWVAGAPSVPYVLGAMMIVGSVSGLTLAYAQRRGVSLTGGPHVLRWRLLPFVGLLVAMGVGVLRADAGGLPTSFAKGMVAGAVVGLVLAVLAVWRGVASSR